MANSSSLTSRNTPDGPTITKLNDALYELYKPAEGLIEIQIVLFHGLQAQISEDAYLKAWMHPEHSQCWLITWLAEEFPKAHIMSVSYDSSTRVTDVEGRMDLYVASENLAQSIIGLERVGQNCPVVLVGHCIGGLVLKQVCLLAEERGARQTGPDPSPYNTFLGNMKAILFYSTPQSGSRVLTRWKRRGPLLEYFELLCNDTARLNSSFAALRRQYGWKTRGACEANKSIHQLSISNPISRLFGFEETKPQLVVEEGSARPDMDDFCVLAGEDNFSICKPRHQSSSNYQFLVKLVREVIRSEKLLKYWRFDLGRPQLFVDSENRVEEVIRNLRLGEAEPSGIALVGMGGVGKTTLAKEIFVQIREKFDIIAFVEDVKSRLQSKHADLPHLVAENLYTGNGHKVRLQDFDSHSLGSHLLGKRGLIVLDDVEFEKQIESILPINLLGPGSRFIITSREQRLELMPTFSMYEMPFLSSEESEILFRAYLEPSVISSIPRELIQKVVLKCDGLPLTLEVIGSFLHLEKNPDNWNRAWKKLGKAESLKGRKEDQLWDKLKVSYDDLAPYERKMFRDLATIQKCGIYREQSTFGVSGGKFDLDISRALWIRGLDDSSVQIGLQNLVHRSLIQIRHRAICSERREIWIHEQLRDLGRRICRPPDEKIERCRGVWEPDDVTNLLCTYKGDDAKTEVVWASLDQITPPSIIRWSSIAKLRKLRLLRLSNAGMMGNEKHRFPDNLTFLHLSSCFRKSTGMFDIRRSNSWPIREEDVEELHHLSVLYLENCSSVVLPSNFHELRNLKILIICGKYVKNLPENFGRLSGLKILVLQNVELSVLPHSIWQLLALRALTLTGCSVIKFVPKLYRWEENAGHPFCSLTKLELVNLPNLTQLPETFGLLQALESLNIRKCHALEQLPEDFGKLVNLKCLRIFNCERFVFLFESLQNFPSLDRLLVRLCPRCQDLPEAKEEIEEIEDNSFFRFYKLISEYTDGCSTSFSCNWFWRNRLDRASCFLNENKSLSLLVLPDGGIVATWGLTKVMLASVSKELISIIKDRDRDNEKWKMMDKSAQQIVVKIILNIMEWAMDWMQDKAKEIQDSIKKMQDKGKKMQDKAKEIQDKGKKMQDKGKKIQDKGKKIEDMMNRMMEMMEIMKFNYMENGK